MEGFFSTNPRDYVLPAVAVLAVVFGVLAFRKITYEDPPLPAAWLTESDQESLVDLISLVETDDWVAGCLWEKRDPSEIREVLDEPAGESHRWRSRTRMGRTVSLLSVEGAEDSDDLDEVRGPGYFCYVPTTG